MQTRKVKIIPMFKKKKNSDKISVNTNWSVKGHPRASHAEQSGPQDGKGQSCP